MNIKNRKGEIIKKADNSQELILKSLYGTFAGRCLLKVLTQPTVSKAAGAFMDSGLSAPLIKPFIRKNNINISEYQMNGIKSYNDFFTRRVKSGKRPIELAANAFISPCDAKLSIYKIHSSSTFKIKNSFYRIADLVNNSSLAKKYKDGWCMIFRLEVDDYHRYCYIDRGFKHKNIHINGELHTVNPIALKNCNIYKRNSREYTVLHTKNFGDVTQVEVGAMMVGKILNHHGCYHFEKGEEKGMFLFGGSTTVLLVEKNKIIPCAEFLENTAQGFETVVKMGEKIGYKLL